MRSKKMTGLVLEERGGIDDIDDMKCDTEESIGTSEHVPTVVYRVYVALVGRKFSGGLT